MHFTEARRQVAHGQTHSLDVTDVVMLSQLIECIEKMDVATDVHQNSDAQLSRWKHV